MNREELQAYLQSQLAEIRLYQSEQSAGGRGDFDMRRAIEEWTERYGAMYQERWLRAKDAGLESEEDLEAFA